LCRNRLPRSRTLRHIRVVAGRVRAIIPKRWRRDRLRIRVGVRIGIDRRVVSVPAKAWDHPPPAITAPVPALMPAAAVPVAATAVPATAMPATAATSSAARPAATTAAATSSAAARPAAATSSAAATTVPPATAAMLGERCLRQHQCKHKSSGQDHSSAEIQSDRLASHASGGAVSLNQGAHRLRSFVSTLGSTPFIPPGLPRLDQADNDLFAKLTQPAPKRGVLP
jgi:hypothetical protein